MPENRARARLAPHGQLQVIEVAVRGGYWPGAIVARAGMPLRIVFRRDDDDGCSERVVFSRPRIDRRLVPRGETTVHLPAQPAGEVRFTCGMGRYRGRIEFMEQSRWPLVARLRDRTSQIEAPIGIALLLWLCSLPLIAILALVFLDGAAAVGLAVVALVAWAAGCLLAFRSRPST